MKRYAQAVAAAAVMLVLGGCGESSPSDTSGSADSPTAAEPEESVTKSPQPSPEPSDGASPRRGVVADAVRDLARRLSVEQSQITVVSAEEVTWRDGSMGCPRPGMMYPQVLTDGSRVVLEAQGQRYEYHAGGRRSAFLCENPEPPAGR
jgi:hypothetical protein